MKAWTIKFTAKAAKVLNGFDKGAKQRVENLIDRLSQTDNPRSSGKALQGALSGLWRYRVGDYRLIAQIKDNELIILVLEIDHRKDIYR
jgi:mRNA interferase RelE/StbE